LKVAVWGKRGRDPGKVMKSRAEFLFLNSNFSQEDLKKGANLGF